MAEETLANLGGTAAAESTGALTGGALLGNVRDRRILGDWGTGGGGAYAGGNSKHRLYTDFGYPDALTDADLLAMYYESPLAYAAVEHTLLTCWQSAPEIRYSEEEPEQPETDLAEMLARTHALSVFREAHRRAMVTGWSAIVMRIADNLNLTDPVEGVDGEPEALVELIPLWSSDLTVERWHESKADPDLYGTPAMFTYNELDSAGNGKDAVNVHPDRVLIFSRDGTMNCVSALRPGFNTLSDIVKMTGGAAEAIYKMSRRDLHLDLNPKVSLEAISTPEVKTGPDAGKPVDPKAEVQQMLTDFEGKSRGALVTKGMSAQVLSPTLGNVKEALDAAITEFAASIPIPTRILLGNQQAERSSTEDAREWARTCEGMWSYFLGPRILDLVRRLERFGVLPEENWALRRTPLTQATPEERVKQLDSLSTSVERLWKSGRRVPFTDTELREAIGLKPLDDDQREEILESINPAGVDDMPDEPPTQPSGGAGASNGGQDNG